MTRWNEIEICVIINDLRSKFVKSLNLNSRSLSLYTSHSDENNRFVGLSDYFDHAFF